VAALPCEGTARCPLVCERGATTSMVMTRVEAPSLRGAEHASDGVRDELVVVDTAMYVPRPWCTYGLPGGGRLPSRQPMGTSRGPWPPRAIAATSSSLLSWPGLIPSVDTRANLAAVAAAEALDVTCPFEPETSRMARSVAVNRTLPPDAGGPQRQLKRQRWQSNNRKQCTAVQYDDRPRLPRPSA
jgi:hypothetical protein